MAFFISSKQKKKIPYKIYILNSNEKNMFLFIFIFLAHKPINKSIFTRIVRKIKNKIYLKKKSL